MVGDAAKDAAETLSATVIVRATPPLVTVIVALLVPTTAEDSTTLVAMDPLPVPEEGLSRSQVALLLAVHALFAVTVTVGLTGVVPP